MNREKKLSIANRDNTIVLKLTIIKQMKKRLSHRHLGNQ